MAVNKKVPFTVTYEFILSEICARESHRSAALTDC